MAQRDFSDGQYYITGKLDPTIFAYDCEFIDPTTNVKGPGTYSRAVAALFDHDTSRADLISIEVHSRLPHLMDALSDFVTDGITNDIRYAMLCSCTTEVAAFYLQVTDPHTITSRWRFDAAINFPGKPRIKPYTGSTRYIIKDGLVQQHIEKWDISTLDAFVSIFIPSFGAPPAPPVASLTEQSQIVA